MSTLTDLRTTTDAALSAERTEVDQQIADLQAQNQAYQEREATLRSTLDELISALQAVSVLFPGFITTLTQLRDSIPQ